MADNDIADWYIPTPEYLPRLEHLAGDEGFVYVAECDTGHVKIGKSKTPLERIKHFDTIMPVEVRILNWFYCDNYHEAERQLQAEFREWRYKGEWFSLPGGMLEELTDIFCYIDGAFHRIWQVQRDCCWHFAYNHLKNHLKVGSLCKTKDYLPY